MKVHLEGIGKKFRKEWIFKNVSLLFLPGAKYAIVGHNGSGKSTLLQLIAGVSLSSAGTISFESKGQTISLEESFQRISFSAPYQELIEELTGQELFDFHYRFRSLIQPFSATTFFRETGLAGHENKQVKFYSSGMKQRMRLALCAYTKADLYLFDEPSTNLDAQGTQWYLDLVNKIPSEKTVIISSNIAQEYAMCENVINITQYKNKVS